jgi:D-glycero-alpha-D-manno-heptose-7-phosphate kinase
MFENLHCVKQLGYESKAAFESGDLRRFAEIMRVHWENKKKRSAGMSTGLIDEYYDLALKNGALGGKLIGAGGGGFLMFYTEDKTRLRRAMCEAGLREVRFRFDFEGTRVLAQS